MNIESKRLRREPDEAIAQHSLVSYPPVNSPANTPRESHQRSPARRIGRRFARIDSRMYSTSRACVNSGALGDVK